MDITISKVGNVIPQGTNAASKSDSGKEEAQEILFASIMSRYDANPGTELFTADGSDGAVDAMTGTDTDVSDVMDRYRYRDSGIRQRDQKAELSDGSLKDRLDDYGSEVKRVLKEELGITDEQIETAMEELGITVVDLLNPNRLAELVADLTGCQNVSDLLCNSEFMAVLQEVIGLKQELLSSLGISAEELAAMMEITEASPDLTGEQAGIPEASEEPVFDGITEDMSEQDRIPVEADAQKTAVVQEPESRNEIPQEEAAEEAEPIKAVTEENAGEEEAGDFGNETSDIGEKLPETADATAKDRQSSGFGGNASEHGRSQGGSGETLAAAQQTPEAVPVQNAEMTSAFTEQLDVPNIIRQIVEYTQIAVNNSATTLEMQLNPENLGKLFLEITSKDGNVSAHITVQNEAVKEAIEAQIVELKQNMNQAGIKVEAVEVTIGSHEFERNLEQNASRDERQAEEQERTARQTRRINLNSLDELGGMMTEEESLVAQMMADQGNTVDFTA